MTPIFVKFTSCQWKCLLVGWMIAAYSGCFGAPASGQISTNRNTADFIPNLPLIYLKTTNSISPDIKVPCAVGIVDKTRASSVTSNSRPALIRYHGATSLGFPKKSFGLTLTTTESLLGMRNSTQWILQAAYIDRSLMRHKLSYDLFRSLSTKDNPRIAAGSRFAEVYLNERYHGVFLLMERVDRQLFGFGPYRSNDVHHACIYKAEDHAANFAQPGHAGYEQREPDITTKEYWKPLDEFNRFVSTSSSSQFNHTQNGIGSKLNLDNAIDFHLLVLFTCNSDGITKNFLIGRDAQSSGTNTQRFVFAPWDYDGTFGRNWDGNRYSPSVWLSNNLFDRLMEDKSYRTKFVSRWNQLRDREFSIKTVSDMIDQNVLALGDAVERNATRWPIRRGNGPNRTFFDEDVAYMKSWIQERHQWLDQTINQYARE